MSINDNKIINFKWNYIETGKNRKSHNDSNDRGKQTLCETKHNS